MRRLALRRWHRRGHRERRFVMGLAGCGLLNRRRYKIIRFRLRRRRRHRNSRFWFLCRLQRQCR